MTLTEIAQIYERLQRAETYLARQSYKQTAEGAMTFNCWFDITTEAVALLQGAKHEVGNIIAFRVGHS